MVAICVVSQKYHAVSAPPGLCSCCSKISPKHPCPLFLTANTVFLKTQIKYSILQGALGSPSLRLLTPTHGPETLKDPGHKYWNHLFMSPFQWTLAIKFNKNLFTTDSLQIRWTKNRFFWMKRMNDSIKKAKDILDKLTLNYLFFF